MCYLAISLFIYLFLRQGFIMWFWLNWNSQRSACLYIPPECQRHALPPWLKACILLTRSTGRESEGRSRLGLSAHWANNQSSSVMVSSGGHEESARWRSHRDRCTGTGQKWLRLREEQIQGSGLHFLFFEQKKQTPNLWWVFIQNFALFLQEIMWNKVEIRGISGKHGSSCPIIQALSRLREEDGHEFCVNMVAYSEFQASLSYIIRFCLNKQMNRSNNNKKQKQVKSRDNELWPKKQKIHLISSSKLLN